MLKHRLFILMILTAMCSVASDAAGRLASSFFADAAADVIFSQLPQSRRLDMIDYYNAGLSTPSKNVYGGDAVVVSVEPSRVKFSSSSAVETTLDVLVNGNDTVLMVIDTYSLPQRDSRVRFFDKHWLPIYRTVYEEPALADWLTVKSDDNINKVTDAIKFMLVSADYDPATSVLTLTDNTASYFVADDVPEALSLLQPTLQLAWHGGKFKLLKK